MEATPEEIHEARNILTSECEAYREVVDIQRYEPADNIRDRLQKKVSPASWNEIAGARSQLMNECRVFTPPFTKVRDVWELLIVGLREEDERLFACKLRITSITLHNSAH
ncbi:hypothetical protein L9F63_000505 [Diploptera punctata]|uniref:Uncharacterized protein n=1 Tax=Diploptera punctata TaxID=6984 RepID=A0AAD8AN85_DIPPU|nr:hypothetical protein L9F63_000505 [Diploptera punctata]